MSHSPENSSAKSDAKSDQAVRLWLDSTGQLSGEVTGQTHENVSPVRLFPLSRPTQWISLIDNTGREIVCLEDPQVLDEASRRVLEEELSRREFVPIIRRITWVSGNSEPCEWKVETDRGPTSFVLKHEQDVRRLGEVGVLVVDSFGIRYFIPDRNQLDKHSRRIVEWYV